MKCKHHRRHLKVCGEKFMNNLCNLNTKLHKKGRANSSIISMQHEVISFRLLGMKTDDGELCEFGLPLENFLRRKKLANWKLSFRKFFNLITFLKPEHVGKFQSWKLFTQSHGNISLFHLNLHKIRLYTAQVVDISSR